MWRTIGRFGVQQTRSPSTEFRGPNILSGLWRSTYTGYYDGDSTWFDQQTPIESIPVDNFDLYDGDIFSSQWLGYFQAPHTATYTFYRSSDDASGMWFGENAITGYTDLNQFEGTIELEEGDLVPIRLQYGNAGGAKSLSVSWSDDFIGIMFELDASTYTSGTTWADSSSYGRDATLHGDIAWDSDAGGCFVIVPNNPYKYIDIAGSESGWGIRNVAPNATFSIWAKITQTEHYQQIGGWRDNNFNFYFLLLNDGITTEARVSSAYGTHDIQVDYSSYYDSWTLITVATNSTTSSLYLNDTLVGTNTGISGTQWAGDALFTLGVAADLGITMNGKIGGAIAYSRELTQLEVIAEYNRTKTRYML